jgi:hypothetical protein
MTSHTTVVECKTILRKHESQIVCTWLDLLFTTYLYMFLECYFIDILPLVLISMQHTYIEKESIDYAQFLILILKYLDWNITICVNLHDIITPQIMLT